jgi:hypothetical protein
MKISNINDPKRFFEIIGKCKGKVLMTSKRPTVRAREELPWICNSVGQKPSLIRRSSVVRIHPYPPLYMAIANVEHATNGY